MKQARQRLQIVHSDESAREPSSFRPPKKVDDWSLIVENADAGIAVAQVNKFGFVNKRMLELTGCTRQELLSMAFCEIVHPDDRDRLMDLYSKSLKGEDVSRNNTVRIVAKDGKVNWLLATAIVIIWNGKPSVLVVVTNTPPQKRAGEALDESRKTAETLQKACDKLEDRLAERNEEIKHKTLDLAEANIALKVLLQRRNEDKTEMEENILTNIKELVAPYLEKVKRKVKDKKLQSYLNVLEANLNSVISAFPTRLSSRYLNLTASELEVANLVRHSKSTKEIAEMLTVSVKTVETHRWNIRKKLGLTNKKANLRTHLLSLA